MLQPTNRLTLIDALRPPGGFGLESAMAVTFTLDLQALLAAPAALALTGADGIVSDAGQHEPIELLHALRTHAGKLTVFCQAGEIALPPSRRVFAFLEQAVIPVFAPRGGIVHPKVWVLRYETVGEPAGGRSSEQRLRVLVASRNLTFDASWDTVVRLDETIEAAGASLARVGHLFEGLLDTAVDDIPAGHHERVRSLTDALGAASFALPAGVEDLRTHVLGLTDTPSPLPAAAERSLIISPFVSDDFFTRVHPVAVDELVSTPEWLDNLEPESLARVETVHTFDDGSAPDFTADDARSSPHDPGRPLVGLHAKVFAFEEKRQARLFLGSANATGAAFSSNVEILLELVGAREVLGIDRLCNGTGDEQGLRDFFWTYYRAEPPPEPNGNGQGALDSARRAISRLRFDGSVEESGDGWAVTYRSLEPLCAPDGTLIRCWPLASAGNRRRVATGEPLEARFETTLEALSGFLAFELAHEDDEDARTDFVVPVPLHGVPEFRERLLMRALVGNAERFLRYLLALLEEDPDQMTLLDAVEGVGWDVDDGRDGSPSLPVLEKLLRTMRRDPAKLAGLHPLVSDLAADDALPPGFAELWATIYDVAHGGNATP
ncbi:MAG: hypothetical protein F4121_02535 [Acidimicrobiia bacterium]|nr:hypothetical protein [Acidimicrobiia bacterium]MYC46463.1 hypothetical protein [Acidimicrobiia bacterium]MYI18985.1 hypothetical protein [Acidimicrobiia bacterium]